MNLESIYSQRILSEMKTEATIIEGNHSRAYKKNLAKCGVVGDLGKLGKKLQIRCNGTVVREFIISENHVTIVAGDDSIILVKETPVYYEPWFMDRGSYLVWMENRGYYAKLATEYDVILKITDCPSCGTGIPDDSPICEHCGEIQKR